MLYVVSCVCTAVWVHAVRACLELRPESPSVHGDCQYRRMTRVPCVVAMLAAVVAAVVAATEIACVATHYVRASLCVRAHPLTLCVAHCLIVLLSYCLIVLLYPAWCDQVTDWVEKHEIIAEVTDIFGNLRQRYLAPESGIIVGKSCNPTCSSGSRLVHLGVTGEHFAQNIQDGH